MEHKKIKLFTVIAFCMGFTGIQAQTLKDIDGNVYHTTTIGTQVWMCENLKTTRYRNGNPIPRIMDSSWENLTIAAYCDYGNAANSNTYGRLYNWYAVKDSRNIAPPGWHVATDAEWTILIGFLGGESNAGSKLKEKSRAHWQYANEDATNETFFSAQPGGSHYKAGSFGVGTWGIGDFGFWWSSTESDKNNAYYRTMNSTSGEVYRSSYFKLAGYSVRCLRD
jgi:uncharacterized protein (TIGR02145 family)